jgi:DNA-binding transcriptional LysR family regulator
MTESLKSISLFVAVYEERSFTAAAKREGATQSGVSQSIGKLEERLRVSLFSRVRGRISATPAADAFYQSCIEVLRAHADAGATASRFAGGIAGEIRIGLIPVTTRAVLAPALQRFTARHSNVSVSISEGYSRILTQQVRAGAFDFAIVPAPPRPIAGLKVRPFLTSTETLVSGLESSRRPFATVRLADERRLKIVLPAEPNIRRQMLESYFAANNVVPQSVIELDAMMGTLDFVEHSDWVTILPGIMIAAELKHPRFVVNPIADPALSLDLVAIEPARKVMTPAARAFFEIFAQEAARVNAESERMLRPRAAGAGTRKRATHRRD